MIGVGPAVDGAMLLVVLEADGRAGWLMPWSREIFILWTRHLSLVIPMDEKEMQALIKPIKTSSLKEEIKKRNLKPGRCPTKMDLAKMLPEETLRELAGT